MMFNLLNERSADATVTGRVTEDSQGHARVVKYINKVKSSQIERISNKAYIRQVWKSVSLVY